MTKEAAQEIVDKIHKLRANGAKNNAEAAKELGIRYGTYYKAKRILGLKMRMGSPPGRGIIYRIGASITSDAQGHLQANCPICQWDVHAADPREINNSMARHYRFRHPKEHAELMKNRRAYVPPPSIPKGDEPFLPELERRLVLESFPCPHCTRAIVVRHAGELEVYSKVNLNNNSNHE